MPAADDDIAGQRGTIRAVGTHHNGKTIVVAVNHRHLMPFAFCQVFGRRRRDKSRGVTACHRQFSICIENAVTAARYVQVRQMLRDNTNYGACLLCDSRKYGCQKEQEYKCRKTISQ